MFNTFNLLYDDYNMFINLHSKCVVSLAGRKETEPKDKRLQQVGAKGVLCLLL